MTTGRDIDRAETLLHERAPDQALAIFDDVLTNTPDEIDAWIGRGRALNNLRRPAEAEAAFREALLRAPQHSAAHNFLGHVLRVQGRATEAARAFTAAIEFAPDMAVAHYNLGTVLAMTGDYGAAAVAFERSLKLGRVTPELFLSLGELYQFLERYSDALELYRRATQTYADDARLWQAMAEFRHSLGEVEQARVAYDRTLALNPGSVVALSGRALLDELWGDIDAGLALLADAPSSPLVDYARARLLRRKGQTTAALDILQRLHTAQPAALANDPRLYFSLAEVLDEAGRYDEAFAVYAQANARKPARFEPAAFEREVSSLIKAYTRSSVATMANARTDDTQPVFIVGMPRSGTSLAEQVLASHSQVHAGGERFEMLDILHKLRAANSYPESATRLSAQDLDKLRRRYRASYGSVGAATVWTDKLPKNFLHLGLIAQLFPDARIVYCRRDPRDTGLSVYFQNMNFRSDPWTSKLDHIVAYSKGCERLMTHWRSVLPVPLWSLQYEDVIEQPEAQIRRLLEFLKLPWEPACLDFHRTRRLVNTASYAQVRKPIYRTSVGRWRHYERHLGPLAQLPQA